MDKRIRLIRSPKKVGQVVGRMKEAAIDVFEAENNLLVGCSIDWTAYILRLKGGRWGVGVHSDTTRYVHGGIVLYIVLADDEDDARRIASNATRCSRWMDPDWEA